MFLSSTLQKHLWPLSILLPVDHRQKSAIWYEILCLPLKLSMWRLTCQRFSQGDKQLFNWKISFRIQHSDSRCEKWCSYFPSCCFAPVVIRDDGWDPSRAVLCWKKTLGMNLVRELWKTINLQTEMSKVGVWTCEYVSMLANVLKRLTSVIS